MSFGNLQGLTKSFYMSKIPTCRLETCKPELKGFSLNMPLAYRVLTYIWKRMGGVCRGSGRSLAGARLKITMLFECHPQKRFVKLTFRSQNCKRTESGAILWNPAFWGFRKRMKTQGFWRFLRKNNEEPMEYLLFGGQNGYSSQPAEPATLEAPASQNVWKQI